MATAWYIWILNMADTAWSFQFENMVDSTRSLKFKHGGILNMAVYCTKYVIAKLEVSFLIFEFLQSQQHIDFCSNFR
jgi:hypothetical protein